MTLPTLRQGSKGPVVATLQQVLGQISTAYVQVDGDFGPATAAAVQAFQERVLLTPDGVVGPDTWDALQSAAGVSLAPSESDVARTSTPSTATKGSVGPTAPTAQGVGWRAVAAVAAGMAALLGVGAVVVGGVKKPKRGNRAR